MVADGTLLFLQPLNNNNLYYIRDNQFILAFDTCNIDYIHEKWNNEFEGNVLLGNKGKIETIKIPNRKKPKYIKHLPFYINEKLELTFMDDVPLIVFYCGDKQKDQIAVSCTLFSTIPYQLNGI